jgi:hypothetical protein
MECMHGECMLNPDSLDRCEDTQRERRDERPPEKGKARGWKGGSTHPAAYREPVMAPALVPMTPRTS